jgi:hypothetical protein
MCSSISGRQAQLSAVSARCLNTWLQARSGSRESTVNRTCRESAAQSLCSCKQQGNLQLVQYAQQCSHVGGILKHNRMGAQTVRLYR